MCYFSTLPVPPLAGLSFQKQGLNCEKHKRWTGRGGGGGGWSSLIIYLRGKEGSQGEQIVFLPEPSPPDPGPAYLKPKPHRISGILIWWHFNILPWWLFSNIYFLRSRALPPEEMKHVKTHYEKNKNLNTSAVLAVIHTIPTAQRQGSQTLICLPARNESVWWVSDLWVTEHTLQIQFNPWLLVLWRTWENVLLKFNTRSFLLPPMQGQKYACMTPSMACAEGGGSGKRNQGGKRERRDKREKQSKLYAWR